MADGRYARGKIYKLVNNVDEEFYVGSTCTTLAKRLYGHKHHGTKDKKRQVYVHLNAIGWQNVDIVLITEYPCNNKMELERQERYWIEELKPTLNQNIPTRTSEEWKELKSKYYTDNKERIREVQGQYRAENAEKLREYHRKHKEANREEILERQRERYEQYGREDSKQYYVENADRIREVQAKYRAENAEKLREYYMRYKEANREAISVRQRERYAKKKAERISQHEA
jgi:group I intron endonuclease